MSGYTLHCGLYQQANVPLYEGISNDTVAARAAFSGHALQFSLIRWMSHQDLTVDIPQPPVRSIKCFPRLWLSPPVDGSTLRHADKGPPSLEAQEPFVSI